MAVIALRGFGLNYSTGLGAFENLNTAFTNTKQSSAKLRDALGLLKFKTDIVAAFASVETSRDQIQKAKERETQKTSALTVAYHKLDALISDIGQVDQQVFDFISSREDDFYKQYYYLKPESKKSTGEKISDAFSEGWKNFTNFLGGLGEAIANAIHNVCAWCKEHWKLLATAFIAIAAVAVIVLSGGTALGVLSPLLLLLAKGALIGTAVGGLSGGVINSLTGGSFWEGFEDGAFNGAVTGLLSGGIGYGLSGGGQITLTLGKTVLNGVISNGTASLLSNLGDILIAGDDISFGEVVSDFLISSFIAGGFAAGGFYLNKMFSGMPSLTQGRTTGRGSWSHIWKTQLTRSLAYGTKVSLKTIMKGIGASVIDEIGDIIISPFNDYFTDLVDSRVGA